MGRATRWGDGVRTRIAWLGLYLVIGTVLVGGLAAAIAWTAAPSADPGRCGETIVHLEFAGTPEHADAIIDEWRTCAGADGVDGIGAARASILRDTVALIPAYVVVLAYWCTYGAWCAFKPKSRQLYARLAIGAGLAGVLDLVENLGLWRLVGGAGAVDSTDVMLVTIATWIKWPLFLAASAAGLVAFVSAWARWFRAIVVGAAAQPEFFGSQPGLAEPIDQIEAGADEEEVRAARTAGPDGVPWAEGGRAELGVCFSGGGIRAASFALGALQALQAPTTAHPTGVLAGARYLATVSGGGYAGTAHQLLSHQHGAGGSWFAEGSPELDRLRDRRRFLWGPPTTGRRLSSTRDFLTGVLTAVAGIVFNLFVVLGALYVVARPLGWAVRELRIEPDSGVLTGWAIATIGFAMLQLRTPAGQRGVAAALTIAGSVLLGIAVFSGEVHGLVGFGVPPLVGAGVWGFGWLRNKPKGGVVLSALTGVAAGLVYAIGWWWVRSGRRGGPSGSVEWRPLLVIGILLAFLVVFVVVLAGSRLVLERWRGRRRGWELVAAGLVGSAAVTSALLVPVIVAFYDDRASRVTIQWHSWAVIAGLLAFVYVFLDQKRWSPHPIYKRRLASTFAMTLDAEGRPATLPYRVRTTLSEWARRPEGGPELLVCAATYDKTEQVAEDVPAWPFVFSADHCGGPEVGWMRTIDFEAALGKANGGDGTSLAAMAISGAAVSPAIGNVDVGPFSSLIPFLNARLGVWLPSPAYVAQLRRLRSNGPVWSTVRRPTHVLKEIFNAFDRRSRFVYVTDGGQLDNLGLTELIARGCRTIICFDASGDSRPGTPPSVGTLRGVAKLAHVRLGATMRNEVEGANLGGDLVTAVTPDPTVWVDASGRTFEPGMKVVASPVTRLVGEGPSGEFEVIVAKAVLTNDIDPVCVAHAATKPGRRFPSHSTVDQWLDEDQFDAYVALGRRAGAAAVARYEAGRAES